MSTPVLTSPSPKSSHGGTSGGDVRLTFPRIVRSEWVKFRTLRSTVWTLAITLVVIVGIVTLFSGLLAATVDDGNAGNIDGMGSTFVFSLATNLAQLAVVVLGVLVITGEYSTGMIRSTLVTVPRRLPALWAKGVVLAVSVFLASSIAVSISLGVMWLFLHGKGKGLVPDVGDDGTVRILLGVPLYLTGIALLAFAIGALLRHSAGALATVLGLILVVENLFLVPWRPLELIGPFLPGTAGRLIVMPQEQLNAIAQGSVGTTLGPWQGYAVLVAWVAVLLTAAAVLLRRRNA